MKTRKELNNWQRSPLAAVILLLLTSSLEFRTITVTSYAALAPSQVEQDWRRLGPRDEEFSILTPVQPSIFAESAGFTFANDGEKVLERRAYSAYADRCVFVVESYKASHPKTLLKEMKHIFDRLEFLEDVNSEGFVGKKYQPTGKSYSGFVYYFVTTKHVYTLTVAAKDANHPNISGSVTMIPRQVM